MMFITICMCFYLYTTGVTGQDDPCACSPCLNSGYCRPRPDEFGNATSYACMCPPYYTGDHCQISEVEQNACFSLPCKNGGTCLGSASAYRCDCPSPWTGLQCNIGSCPDPGTPNNGIRTGNSVIVGSKVTYSCQDGYHLIGSEVIQCLANQTWSDSLPYCQYTGLEIEPATQDPRTPLSKTGKCDDPGEPVNGIREGIGFDIGDTVTFSCWANFHIIGATEITCQVDLTWSAPTPVCGYGSTCPDPGQPSNGYRIGDIFEPGSSVSFKCNDGYNLVGNTPLYCLAPATWHHDTPICQANQASGYSSGTVAAAAIVPVVISVCILIVASVLDRHRLKNRWRRAVEKHKRHEQTSGSRLSSISGFSFRYTHHRPTIGDDKTDKSYGTISVGSEANL